MGLVEPAQHPLDLGHEAHVGHAVGLVEHQHLELVDRQLAPVAEVDEAPRGGDDDVDPLAELGDLAVDVGAAVDGHGVQPELLGQRGQDVVDLDGQLPRRQQDEGERPGRARGGRPCASRVPWPRWRSGTPKARVLPEPVLALPQTSRPARASATVRAWIGKALMMPWSASALVSSAGDAEGLEGPGGLVGVVAGDVAVPGRRRRRARRSVLQRSFTRSLVVGRGRAPTRGVRISPDSPAKAGGRRLLYQPRTGPASPLCQSEPVLHHDRRRATMAKLEAGATAPAFTLPDQDGKPV